MRRDAARGRAAGELPAQFRARLLSLRAYAVWGDMVDAEVMEGREAEPLIRSLLARADVAHIDAHFARRGCFGGRITRA